MPEDFTGHSLSVSDVVVVHKEGADHAYYVDRFGYEEIPQFLAPVQTQEKDVTVETKRDITPERADESPQKTGEAAQAIPSKDAKQPERKKASVLGKLGEKQKQIKAERAKPEKQQKQKAQAVKRGKGEQAI